MGGSSSTTSTLSGAALMPRCPAARDLGRDRQPDRKYRSCSIAAVRRSNRPVHGFHEAARNRKPKSGARPHLIALLRAVELVKDVLQFRRPECRRPRPGSARQTEPLSRQLSMRIVVPVGAYFAALSSKIEQDLLEKDRIQLEHGQIGGELELDVVVRQNLARAAQRAADDLARDREARHSARSRRIQAWSCRAGWQ